jgi:hypothetical protein
MPKDTLIKRVEKLEARNKRVEADKAWETSLIRRASIAALTYIVVVSYLSMIHADHKWVHALVPVIGFLLSTLTISLVKQWWISQR